MAIDISLNKKWAIKRISLDSNFNMSNSFSNEAFLMKDLDHPILPRVVDVFNDNESLYIVMDYIDGVSLDDLIKKNGVITEKKVLSIMNCVTDALIYLHSKKPPIIHRDIKPSNIIITKDGFVKLIDFGIAREYKKNNNFDTSYMGTRGFAAPEQFLGLCQTDERTDIYSLGVTGYYSLTGKSLSMPPYKICPIRTIDKSFSKKTEQIILRCTEDDPEKRYKNANELKKALKNADKTLVVTNAKDKVKKAMIIIFCIISVGIISIRASFKVNANEYEMIDELIQDYKVDGVFTISEEEELISIIENINNIELYGEEYGQLMYKIGLLYWYYFNLEDNSNLMTGIICSKNYFDKAIKYLSSSQIEYEIAVLYLNLSEYIYDSRISVSENIDKINYDLFSNVSSYIDLIKQEDNEYIKHKACSIALSIINSSVYHFKDSNVEKANILKLLEEIKSILNIVNSENKEEIFNSLDYAKENIISIYREDSYEY